MPDQITQLEVNAQLLSASRSLPEGTRTVAVIGASGRVGSAVSSILLDAGHDVIGVSRTAAVGFGGRPFRVDVLDPAAVRAALDGADAVVVTLGITENPLSVRLRGARSTAADVRSRGTANVIAAMHELDITRIVALSSFGVAESAAGLSPVMKVVVAAMLAPQFRDHAVQERIVRDSDLAWTIARPVNLVAQQRAAVYVDPAMRTVGMQVGVDQVAGELARWAVSQDHVGSTVALSS